MKIPFSLPDISEHEIEEVSAALRSNWITTGPRTKELEKRLASWLGTEKCVCLNSQTSCAEMGLRLLGIGEGDEIITCAYTYTATASVVCHTGADLKLIDTQKDSLEMDYDALENAITEKTKAVIPVDIGGVPCDYDRIFEIVESKKHLFRPKSDMQKAMGRIAVCADAAHALGAKAKDRMVGNIADFSAFSFHAVKNLTTAEGGALTWRTVDGIDNDALYRRLQLMSLHGQSKDAFAKSMLGGWEYDIVGTWYKCNMTDIAAALGLAQLDRYPDMLKRRREIIERYDTALLPVGIKTLDHYNDRHLSSGHLYITQVPGISAEQRNEIIHKMGERGISCNVHYKPLPMFTAYKQLGFDIKDFPNSYANYKNEITLPLYSSLTDEQLQYIIENYTDTVRSYLR